MHPFRILLSLFFATFFCQTIFAQKEQIPDTLLWNNRLFTITVHRDVPSILQVYYQRSHAAVPFTHWSSENHRGHVASFEVMNNALCLNAIQAIRYKTKGSSLWSASGIDTTVSPDYFDIAPLDTNSTLLVADWFSGIIQVMPVLSDKGSSKKSKTDGYHLLRITNGKIVDDVLMPLDNSNRLNSRQQSVLDEQGRFLNFYARTASDREWVSFKGHTGRFDYRPYSLTLFMDKFGNDPLLCPSGWSDSSSCSGAPLGTWTIRDDSIFLLSLSSHQGKDLYLYDSCQLDLIDAMRPLLPLPDGSFFANWLSGDFVIHYGTFVTDPYGLPDYLVKKTQRLRLKNGVIISSSFSPSGFDDDSIQLASVETNLCDENNLFSVDDKQLAESVGKMKTPKKSPAFPGGKTTLRNWFLNKPLTDQRAKDRLFRVRIGFIVNCQGKASNFSLLNKPKGELFEFSNMVLDIVKEMPQTWEPATDRKGNPVDCWQVLEFTVSNGILTNADYK